MWLLVCSSPRILQSNGLRRLLNNHSGALVPSCIRPVMAPNPAQNRLIHPRCLPEMESTSSPTSFTTKLLMRLVAKVATQTIFAQLGQLGPRNPTSWLANYSSSRSPVSCVSRMSSSRVMVVPSWSPFSWVPSGG